MKLYCHVQPSPRATTKKLNLTLKGVKVQQFTHAPEEKRSSLPLLSKLGEWNDIYAPSLRGTAFR